jgi:hypothetical protein
LHCAAVSFWLLSTTTVAVHKLVHGQAQAAFIKALKPTIQQLEKNNLTIFSPHYVTWSCPPEYRDSAECKNECIMDGKYCSVSTLPSFARGGCRQ